MVRARYAVTLVLAGLVLAAGRAGADKFSFPEKQHGKGVLSYRNGIPVLVVECAPDEIGEQVGVLAIKPAARVLAYPEDLLTAAGFSKTIPLFAAAGNKMFAHFPPDYQKELEAMVKASGVQRDRVIVGNTLFDLKKFIG